MNTYKKSLCATCIEVDSCSLTSNKIFIWSCSEFDEKQVSEKKQISEIKQLSEIKRTRKTVENIGFENIKSKKEFALI
ncbi:hypothetical protein [Tenacibaculum piscium]|uniref:Uncharacterized protein n=1 Tax=Tenacibaculum piscium TaxID=1458515 RepID=A0A2H1YEQ7_9FLAO|nr:hypothetical protein [Tenacibaculum piscium]MBE7628833.1 hypothetical protein [Tenacibaculum piscium]MBE7671136.1 hypothetical protein [Tenacibaculum piscium]MBE7685145.1 hypothetical protein [Tenacibaculum piscium]MBE7689848.1 hypothetical protein [Tenacibaculum piscium]MCG8183712.1 hypothetical protein [Tenacibaculum piscium]